MSPSNPLRPPPPARGRCGFTGAKGQCQNPGRWDRDGILSCTTHKNAAHPVPYQQGRVQAVAAARYKQPLQATQHRIAIANPSGSQPGSEVLRQYPKSPETWWQKPLVDCLPNPKPAELLVLRDELRTGESGAWLNSRSTTTGVVDLVRRHDGGFQTVRVNLPGYVSEVLSELYQITRLTKGAPDLVVWSEADRGVRFIEVKCPHWDKVSVQQSTFLRAATDFGCVTSVVEWEFAS
jgi:hypothetical protein